MSPLSLLLAAQSWAAGSCVPPSSQVVAYKPLAERVAYWASAADGWGPPNGVIFCRHTWTQHTRRAALACATVTSAILGQAGYDVGIIESARKLDERLSGWRKIESVSDLKPGDIVFWKFPGPQKRATLYTQAFLKIMTDHRDGIRHVGVMVGRDLLGRAITVDNEYGFGGPSKQPLERGTWDFSHARRPQ